MEHTSDKVNQALRTAAEDFETSVLCNSCKASAASPLGSWLRPVSISLTEDGARPTFEPISAKVIPFLRRSDMRDAQAVIAGEHTARRNSSQRLPVTDFRQTTAMTRPPDLPKFHLMGERVQWWRERRKMDRHQLAKAVGQKYSTISDLELGITKQSKKTDVLARVLRLNAHYLRTDEGDPEVGAAPISDGVSWPFDAVRHAEIQDLSKIERGYLETEMQKVLNDIIKERRQQKRRG